MKEEKVYLTLQNGQVFEGKRFGARGDVLGELVFTTGMTGYIETLTDPSYYGQIVIQTFPLIGNYGMIPIDQENKKPYLSGYIVREYCEEPSNFRCSEKICDYLERSGIVGVYGVDTRELTTTVREAGVMNAVISSRPVNDIGAIGKYIIRDAVKNCTCEEAVTYGDEKSAKRKVVLWDFGAKENIARELVNRDCCVIRVPSWYTAEQILGLRPDGVMLTNGPGDPAENTEVIENIRGIAGKLPMFGICLGHQLFALAMGGKTKKMKYGHRGANQPVKELKTGTVYISSQNHGYEVLADSIKGVGELSFINANDNTCEGVEYPALNAFTVQFHPEACAGPLDARNLFDKFMNMMDGGKKNA